MINSAYIAYPIDQRGLASSLTYLFDQIEAFKQDLSGHVSWIFDPGDAFLVNPSREIDHGLARVNQVALGMADVLVAFIPKGVPTIGVPIEVDRARAQGKPILIFSDTKSYMLEGMPGNIFRADGWESSQLMRGLKWLIQQDPYEGVLVHGDLRFVGDEQFRPTQTYGDDAGYDLICSEGVVIPAGGFADVPCGISVEMPERVWGLITGRSSTLRKRGLLVSNGVIDTGYRGPLFAGVQNLNKLADVSVIMGERLAQLILFNNTTMRYRPVQVPELTPSARGVNGFGSSGA